MDQLKSRRRQPELMDQPGLNRNEHYAALRGLQRLNFWSRSVAILWPSIRRVAELRLPQPTRVLDLACGGGDVPVGIARRAQRCQLPIQVDGCDKSEVAIDYSRQLARELRVSATRFYPLDALSDQLPQTYHIIACSLFLHHLSESDGQRLLSRMAAATQSLLLVNDLQRTRVGYALAYLGTRLLCRSHVVHIDGPLSVAGALNLAEAKELAERAGLQGATVEPTWPQRFLLSWRRHR